MKKNLGKTIRRYSKKGIIKGGELLLSPEVALDLLDELEELGEGVMGLDGWRWVDPEKPGEGIFQDLSIDFYVGDDVWGSSEYVTRSIQAVRHYIRMNVIGKVKLVSFTLETRHISRFFDTSD